ncbi:hypothetical protein EON65_47655 [archaeon]|nr:MAG: hypothetical protein EON65_47655 [archaeon]
MQKLFFDPQKRDFSSVFLSFPMLQYLTMEDDGSRLSKVIKLKSAEGHEFFVDRKCAMMSGTIKKMLSGQFAESRGEIAFPEIPAVILEKLIQFLYYKVRYTNSSQRIPEFHVEPEIAMELLIAGGYLDC